MTAKRVRVVHFLNPFFAGLGGEEKTHMAVEAIDGPVGPGRLMQARLGEQGQVVATIVAGDNYFAENTEQARDEALRHIQRLAPDVVVAGPAFNAGRYGMNCGQVASSVSKLLGVPAVTAMYKDNPGVDLFRKDAYILETGNSPAEMNQAVTALAQLALKLAAGEDVGPAETAGYFPRGVRRSGLADRPGWQRAVEMLLAALHGEPFATEIRVLTEEAVVPAPPIRAAEAKLAVVVTSALAPPDNPDHFRFSGPSPWGKYSIAGLSSMAERSWGAFHSGFDTTYLLHDPNYSVPLDVLRSLEDKGVIGGLSDYFYSTRGNEKPDPSSKRMAREIAEDLQTDGVGGVLLVST